MSQTQGLPDLWYGFARHVWFGGDETGRAESDMTDLEARRRGLSRRALARHAGPAVDATAVAAAANRAYDDLARALAPVIGDLGVAAMTDRALHLTTREYAWLPSRAPGSADTTFAQVIDVLKRQDDAAEATEAAAAVFAAIIGLLATFIGEPLAARLVQQAWPDATSSADTQET
jgi:hypothetical protein